MFAWKRLLEVTLTTQERVGGKVRQLKFGKSNGYSIRVVGTKLMSSLADQCTIYISNLPYSVIMQIIASKYYDVEIKAGYETCGTKTVFNGGLLYISNRFDDTKTNTAILICASKLVARYGQSRMNLTLNSGINLYAAINYAARRMGIRDTAISTQLQRLLTQQVTSLNTTFPEFLNNLAKQNESFIINADNTLGNTFSLYDSNKSNMRIIRLSRNNIDLSGGYPTLTNDGLSLTIMPTINLMCGDVIQIDNSLIDISVQNKSEITSNYAYYFNENGYYTLYQISFTLENRGPSFSYDLLCKNRSLVSKFIGK